MRKSPLFRNGQLTVLPGSTKLHDPEESEEVLEQLSKEEESLNKVTCGFEDVIDDEHCETVYHHFDRGVKTFRFGHHSRLHYYSKLRSELSGPGDDAILQYYDSTVYRSDLKNLDTDEWFNDNNISFLYEFLEHHYLEQSGKSEKILLLKPSMAYLLLHTDDPKTLEGVLPPLDNVDYIFLPINDNPDVGQIEGGCHWSLLVIDVGDKTALYYDSLEGSNHRASENTARKIGVLLDSQLDLISVPTPQQINLSDCGVLVCEMSALLLTRLLENDNGKADLNMDNITFVAAAGRTFILTAILELISARNKGKI